MADLSDILGRAPLRMTLTRLDDPTLVLAVQFNPSQMKETGGAEWAKLKVHGLSHEVLQFSNTKNPEHTFQLVFISTDLGENGWQQIIAARLFFRTSVRPVADASTIQGAGAPRLLLFCPNFMSAVCVLDTYTITVERQEISGTPAHIIVDVKLTEIRDTFISATDFFEERP